MHGTEGLRVVDASVFPRVPGLFIASAVYMIGEKAADVIAPPPHADSGHTGNPPPLPSVMDQTISTPPRHVSA